MKTKFKWLVGTILIVMFGLMLQSTSCEDEKTSPSPNQNCSCGSITSFDYDAAGYYVNVKNYCSGNYKWFTVSYSDWFYADYGDECCSNSGSSWKVFPTGEGVEKEQTGKHNIE